MSPNQELVPDVDEAALPEAELGNSRTTNNLSVDAWLSLRYMKVVYGTRAGSLTLNDSVLSFVDAYGKVQFTTPLSDIKLADFSHACWLYITLKSGVIYKVSFYNSSPRRRLNSDAFDAFSQAEEVAEQWKVALGSSVPQVGDHYVDFTRPKKFFSTVFLVRFVIILIGSVLVTLILLVKIFIMIKKH